MFYRKFLILSVLSIYADDNVYGASKIDQDKTDYYDLIMINSLKSIEYLDTLGIYDNFLKLVDNCIEEIGIVKDQDSFNGTVSLKVSLSIFLELYNMFSDQITDDVIFVIEELEKEFVFILTEEFRISSEKEILIECNELFNKMDEKSVKCLQKKFNLENFIEENVRMKIDVSSIYDFLVSSFKGAHNLNVLKKEVIQKKTDKDKLIKALSAFYFKYEKKIPISIKNEQKKNSINWKIGINFKNLIIGCLNMYKKDLNNLQMILLIEKKDLEILKSYEKLTIEYKQLYEEEQELMKLKINVLKLNYARNIGVYLDKYIEFVEKKKKFFNNVLSHKILTGDITCKLIEKYKNE